MRYIFILVMAGCLYSCQHRKKEQALGEKQQEIETGSLDSTNKYTAEEIGWTMNVQEGWDVQSKEDTKTNTEKGMQVIAKTLDTQVDVSGLKQLINLRKGRFNSFLSTIETIDTAEKRSYEEKNQWIYSVIKDAYAAKDIPAEYSEGTVAIDGLNFFVIRIKIYNKDKSEVILRQELYSRQLNGYEFGMTINYHDEEARAELEKMLFSSKFSKRN